VASLAITLGPLSAVAGCGSSESIGSKSAAAILQTSTTAARNASAVHVSSQTFIVRAEPKTKTKPRPASTLELQLSGGDGRAKLALLGSESEAVRIGQTLYVKGGPRLYRRLNERTGAHTPTGTWLKAPANDPELTDFAALTEPTGELSFILRNPTISLTKGATTTVDGQKAIELKTKGKLYNGAIYIAANGTPYPLLILKQGRETARITFTNWDHPAQLAAPTGAVALASLEKTPAGS